MDRAHAPQGERDGVMRKSLPRSVLLLALGVASCDSKPAQTPSAPSAHPDDPASARRDIRDAFEAARAAVKHASDGAGRAWLELAPGDDGSVVASGRRSWTILYEAGELGVVVGGQVFLQVSPFFEWSSPQTSDENASGFTRVTTDAPGVELEATAVDQQLLAVTIRGRALAAGERLRFEYGAGPAGAQADPYAEKGSRLWIAVDGDGDGVRALVADSPAVDVHAGPPSMLVATLPSTARVGDPVRLCVALLDSRANRVEAVEARLELSGIAEGLDLPRDVDLEAAERGATTIEGRAEAEGVYRVRVLARVGNREFEALSNPLLVSSGPLVRWADLHGHTAVSDGTGTPEDYFEYARDVAALDVVALTDHDHWGMEFLDEHAELWERNVAVARSFDAPGRFVALPGFEYTDWIHGHRHVLYFGESAPLLSSMDPRYDTVEKLRDAARGLNALLVPHHPAGGPIAIDWSVPGDAALEPVVEVCSAHGSSEALDCPRVLHSPRPGAFVRDELERGRRMGLVGSGDGHDGHPGLAWKGPHYPTGGVAAILTDDLTAAGVRAALEARRCYATSGPRILLRFAIGGARMGGTLSAAQAASAPMFVQALGTGTIGAVDIVVRGERVTSLPGQGRDEFAASATIDDLKSGDWVYVRVVQLDGGMAWSGPIFIE